MSSILGTSNAILPGSGSSPSVDFIIAENGIDFFIAETTTPSLKFMIKNP
jgi:hypothetical protein